MIAAMTRHLKSLRYMRRDHGWIHTLLEEAENERMHLLTAMVLRNPGPIFKAAVIGTQGSYYIVAILRHFCSGSFIGGGGWEGLKPPKLSLPHLLVYTWMIDTKFHKF